VALLLLLLTDQRLTLAQTIPPLPPYDLSLTKLDNDASPVSPGEEIEYSLRYRNKTNTPVLDVIITEMVPANTVFAGPDAEWSCTDGAPAGTSCQHTVPVLAGDDSGAVQFSVRMIDGPIPAGVERITNKATISIPAFNGPDSNPDDNTAIETTAVNAAPDLTVTKTDGLGAVTPGALLVYTINYGNRGNQGATAVFLAETLPANTQFVAASSSPGWVFDEELDSYTLAIGNLNGQSVAGNTGSAFFAVRVDDPAPAGLDTIHNTVTIAETGNNGEQESTLGDNIASTTTQLVAAADLSLTKTDNNAVATPGAIVAYALTVKNEGNQNATGVTITEIVPANTTFAKEQSGDWDCDDNAPTGVVCTHTVGALASQAQASVIFAVRVSSQIPAGVTQLVNTATAGNIEQPNRTQASDTTPLDAAPDLHLTKSDGGASAQPGDVVVYALAYENRGEQGATGVTITEQIPANTTFNVKASASGWSCIGATCTFAVGELAAGDQGAVDFAVQINANLPAGVTVVANTASIADDQANGADLNDSDNQASDSTLLAATRLAGTKRAVLRGDANGNDEVNPGDTLEYTIEIQNNGDTAVTGVVVKDAIDPNTTLVAGSVQVEQGQVDSTNPLQIIVGELAAGTKATIIFRVTINSPLPASVSRVENQALVESANTPNVATDDPSVPGVNNPTRTPVTGNAVLVLTKADLLFTDVDANDVVSPDDRLLYRLKITNHGDMAAINVVLGDTPDTNTTLIVGSVRANVGAIATGNRLGDRSVEVNVGALPVGQVVDIGFLVVINTNLSTNRVTNQATVTYGRTDDLLSGASDDPDTASSGDATVTTVIRSNGIFLPLVWK
jgi:uncharacterized repeat protein (TIGR01451 family)